MKLEGETDCPTCKKEHPVEIDIDNLDIKKVEIPQLRNARVEQQGQQITQQVEKPIEKIKEVIKVPSYIPKYKCKNCKENHKNKDYKELPRFKCENCGQFSTSNDSCMWCDGKDFEEVEKDELIDMGIEAPEEDEHEHEQE